MKTIIDTFLYFNEFDMLKLRLEYLGPYVKKFIIAESNCDFSGKPKPLSLIHQLKNLPYYEKIIYQPVDINLNRWMWKIMQLQYFRKPAKFLWKIQDAQRNSIKKCLLDDTGLTADYILFGDLDELPTLDFIRDIRMGIRIIQTPHVLCQHLFYYHINNLEPGETWRGTLCADYTNFMRDKPAHFRKYRLDLPEIREGGYHLSYFMCPDLIKKKMETIAVCENLNNFKVGSLSEIKEKISHNADLYGRKDVNFVANTLFLPNELTLLIKKHLPYCM